MFNEIKDFAAPELDVYARTSEVQLLRYYEPEPGIFIAESPKVIERALNAGYQPISFLVEHKDLEGEAREILKQYPDVPVYTAEYELLVKLTGFALTRGMLCAMRRNPLPSVEEICRNASRIAVLENVVNPTNIGAIFRSAAALHMDAVTRFTDVQPESAWELYSRFPGHILIKKLYGHRMGCRVCKIWDSKQLQWLCVTIL